MVPGLQSPGAHKPGRLENERIHGSWYYARNRNMGRAIYHDFTREVSERKELALAFEQLYCF